MPATEDEKLRRDLAINQGEWFALMSAARGALPVDVVASYERGVAPMPIASLPDDVSGDILLWNPCDGWLLIWATQEGPADRIRQQYPFHTHWLPAPAGPKETTGCASSASSLGPRLRGCRRG